MRAKLRAIPVPSPKTSVNPEQLRCDVSRIRLVVRAWASTIPEARRTDLAAIFVRESFVKLAKKLAPELILSEPFSKPYGKLDAAVRSLPDELAELVSGLPLSEAAHSLTSLYTSLLPGHERSSLGAFYTPPALSGRLIELAEEAGINWTQARILDPASGGGAFLLPVADRMRAALEKSDAAVILAQIGARLRGLELDPHAAWFAQAALEIQFADLTLSSGRRLPIIVTVCDTLEQGPTATFDLVIGNPPYGRVKLTPDQRTRFARSLYGHANLYGVFTDIALRWAKPKGVIAYLTPTSFLGGQYFAALRGLLAAEAPPTAIDFVHSRKGVFEDALQETMLALYRKGAKDVPAQVHYLKVGNEREAVLIRNGTIKLPADSEDPWLAPRSPEQSKLASAASRMSARLSDWGYTVSTGPLVWNRFKDQLCERPGKNRYPLIWAEAVTADGQFIFRAEKRNHSPYFQVERGDEWLVVREPSVLVQRTTAKEQSRRLIAAELPASFLRKHTAVVVENHLNMVRPKGKPAITPATLAVVLNSKVVDQVFRCISGSVAVSAFELEALPLPSVESMQTVEALVKAGAASQKIETALAALYLPEAA